MHASRVLTTRVLAAIVVIAVATACGDDGEEAAEPEPTATTALTRTATEAPSADTTGPRSTPSSERGLGPDATVRAEIDRVAGTTADGPFYMVNLLDFADVASYPKDSEFHGSTGREANERYNAVSGPKIAAVGGQPVFVGAVEASLIPGEVDWDIVAIVRYPSRQALVDLTTDEEFAAAVVHKDASLANTFALVTARIALPQLPEVDAGAVPFPPTADDSGFMMVHVIDFRDEARYEAGEAPDEAMTGREAVDLYSQNAAGVAVPLGVRPRAWFEVEGTLLGDHDRWEQIRLNEFPSHATFEALTSNETWAAGQSHRTAGIADTYALMTRPIIYDPTFAEAPPSD